MTDRLKGRVKGLFGTASPEDEILDQTHILSDPDAERQALQVLILARRTADEHVSNARREANTIRSDAQATAVQIARDAQTHADGARREAGRILSDAQAKAVEIAKDAQANADSARREAGQILSDAQERAAGVAKDAQANADGLERDARQRYQDVVGSLEPKRAALQQQIEALQQFDQDYRARLRAFMQSQLHALGDDEQPPNSEIEQDLTASLQPMPVPVPVPVPDHGRHN